MKFTFSIAAKYIGEHLKSEILEAAESDRQLRNEIRRVFQKANRRIQNIRQSEEFSPAVVALTRGDVRKYTVFSMAQSWENLKSDYARAVAFLNQPTSTATGTREYNKQLQERYELDDASYEALSDDYMKKYNKLIGTDFVELYLKGYKDFTQEFEKAYKDVAEQIENDAMKVEEQLNIEEEEEEEEEGDYWGQFGF